MLATRPLGVSYLLQELPGLQGQLRESMVAGGGLVSAPPPGPSRCPARGPCHGICGFSPSSSVPGSEQPAPRFAIFNYWGRGRPDPGVDGAPGGPGGGTRRQACAGISRATRGWAVWLLWVSRKGGSLEPAWWAEAGRAHCSGQSMWVQGERPQQRRLPHHGPGQGLGLGASGTPGPQSLSFLTCKTGTREVCPHKCTGRLTGATLGAHGT